MSEAHNPARIALFTKEKYNQMISDLKRLLEQKKGTFDESKLEHYIVVLKGRTPGGYTMTQMIVYTYEGDNALIAWPLDEIGMYVKENIATITESGLFYVPKSSFKLTE